MIGRLFTAWRLWRIDRKLARIEERWTYWLAYYQQLPHDDPTELGRLICAGEGVVGCGHRDQMRRLAGKRAVLTQQRMRLLGQLPVAVLHARRAR